MLSHSLNVQSNIWLDITQFWVLSIKEYTAYAQYFLFITLRPNNELLYFFAYFFFFC